MEKEFEKLYHQYEKKHFWFKARRQYIVNCLKKKLTNKNDIAVLDIGCSSGILLNELQECGLKNLNLYGVDISEKAIENCRKNGISNAFVMDAQNITLQQQFDVLIASDCLEHLENDEIAIQNWNSLLKKDGILMVFVPAFMSLWSNHDAVNMHYRRYRKKELIAKLKHNGFEIKKSSYWNFLMFFPYSVFILFSRLIQQAKGEKRIIDGQNNLQKTNFLNNIFFLLINFENKLLSFTNFPVGVSVFCIAKKTN